MPAKKLNWFPRKRLVTAISFALTGGSFSAHSAPVYVITDLGVLNGVSSTGYGINSAGDVTGVIELPNEDTHAFVYSNGGMTDLGTLGGGTDSVGKDINDSGQVTGWSDTANGQHAFLYDGQMHDLVTMSLVRAMASIILVMLQVKLAYLTMAVVHLFTMAPSCKLLKRLWGELVVRD